jgi:hypothetical protein
LQLSLQWITPITEFLLVGKTGATYNQKQNSRKLADMPQKSRCAFPIPHFQQGES